MQNGQSSQRRQLIDCHDEQVIIITRRRCRTDGRTNRVRPSRRCWHENNFTVTARLTRACSVDQGRFGVGWQATVTALCISVCQSSRLLARLILFILVFTARRYATAVYEVVVVVVVSVCVCVCVCVCLSHSGIVSKRLNVGSRK